MSILTSTFDTPFGDFSVAVDEDGSVVATAFGRAPRLPPGQAAEKAAGAGMGTGEARKQLGEFLAGKRRDFSLRLLPRGTPFQRRVWAELRRIPFGETRSYGDIARKLGSSPRAVGRAVGSNPYCPIVPCHRVIGSDGSMTGFAFGLGIKRRLLCLEGAGELFPS